MIDPNMYYIEWKLNRTNYPSITIHPLSLREWDMFALILLERYKTEYGLKYLVDFAKIDTKFTIMENIFQMINHDEKITQEEIDIMIYSIKRILNKSYDDNDMSTNDPDNIRVHNVYFV